MPEFGSLLALTTVCLLPLSATGELLQTTSKQLMLIGEVRRLAVKFTWGDRVALAGVRVASHYLAADPIAPQ